MTDVDKSIRMSESAVVQGKLATLTVPAKHIRGHNIIKTPAPCHERFYVSKVEQLSDNTVVVKGWVDEQEMELVYGADEKVTLFPLIRYCESSSSVSIEIQPVGYWTDAVTVRKQRDFFRYDDQNPKWHDAEISWGSGGTTGQMTSQEIASQFRKVLTYALDLAKKLDKKYEGKGE